MSVLKKIADTSVTVEVAGEKIKLRYPDAAEKAAVMEMMPDPKEDGTAGATISGWNALSAKALSVCVIGYDEMTEDDWSRLISASNDRPDEHKGLAELVARSLSMCGLKTDIKAGDPAQDVLDKAGDLPLQ